MKNIGEIIDLDLKEFAQHMIDAGEFKSEMDIKLFILESLGAAHNDPSTEFPIEYATDPNIVGKVEYVEADGPQLTDEFVRENNGNPNMESEIPGQVSMFDSESK
jgi:hypothetical protein